MHETCRSWSEVRERVLGDPYRVWEGEADLEALRALAAHVDVEPLLLEGLLACDPLAADAIGALEWDEAAAERVASALMGCLGAQPVELHLRAAAALVRVTGDELWVPELTRVLSGAGFWGDRLESARVLSSVAACSASVAALGDAVCDPDSLVRRQAVLGLLGVLTARGARPDERGALRAVASGSPPAGWSRTAHDLTRAAERLLG